MNPSLTADVALPESGSAPVRRACRPCPRPHLWRICMSAHLFQSPRKLARPSACRPARPRPRLRLEVEALEHRWVPSTAYLATDLVSDLPGVAPVTDPNLVNAWGISINPGGIFWVSSNGADLSTLYRGDVGTTPLTKATLEVTIPGGAPTGQVFANIDNNFVINGVDANGDPTSAKSTFIFASEAGLVTGWNPGVFATKPSTSGASTSAIVGYPAPDGALYQGTPLAHHRSANLPSS